MRFRMMTYASILCTTGLLLGCDQLEEESPTAPSASVKPQQFSLIGASEPPEWVGALLNGPTIFQADDASTHEELPGLGHKFELQFAMDHDQDPHNSTNDVISFLRFLVESGATVLMSSEPTAAVPDDDLRFMSDGILDLEVSRNHGTRRRTLHAGGSSRRLLG